MKRKQLKRVLTLIMVVLLSFIMTTTGFTYQGNTSSKVMPLSTGGTILNKTADYNTMETYKQALLGGGTQGYMAAVNNQESLNGSRYAGRIWADKSVFSTGENPINDAKWNGQELTLDLADDGYAGNEKVSTNSDFLHVYSVLGSSEVQNESTPLDVVFVVDISNSMTEVNGGESRLTRLISALNSAIDYLMVSNPKNRVGIVPFTTNTPPKEMQIGLGRYKKINENNPYLSNTTNNVNFDNLALEGTEGNVPNAEWSLGLATNVQAGLYAGGTMLANAENTVVDINGKTQSRTPLLFLVSDGAPNSLSASTSADVNDAWYLPRIDVSTYANQTSTADIFSMSEGMNQEISLDDQITTGGTIILSTLLTASYMKNAIANNYKYNADRGGINAEDINPLIYTFGLDTEVILNNDPAEEETGGRYPNQGKWARPRIAAVLDPSTFFTEEFYNDPDDIYNNYFEKQLPAFQSGNINFGEYQASKNKPGQFTQYSNNVYDTVEEKDYNAISLAYTGFNQWTENNENNEPPVYPTLVAVKNVYYNGLGGNPGYNVREYASIGMNQFPGTKTDDQPSQNNYYNVTQGDIEDSIDYVPTENFYQVATDHDISDLFSNIIAQIGNSVFTPLEGENDAGLTDSLTYTDPIGRYMEVENVDNVLLFGELLDVEPVVEKVSFEEAQEYISIFENLEPENITEKQKNTTYTVYQITGDDIDLDDLHWNPSYGDDYNDDTVEDLPIDTPGVFKYKDIDIWVEETPAFTNDEGNNFEIDTNYDIALWINLPASALPLQVATITPITNTDEEGQAVTSYYYSNNLGADNEGDGYYAQSTPFRVFYSVGVDDSILSGNEIDINKIDPEYLNDHKTQEGNVYFYSNYYTGDVPYEDASVTIGNPALTFSPSEDNIYYAYQKNNILYGMPSEEDPDVIYSGERPQNYILSESDIVTNTEDLSESYIKINETEYPVVTENIGNENETIIAPNQLSSDGWYYIVLDFYAPPRERAQKTEYGYEAPLTHIAVARKGSEFGSGLGELNYGENLVWYNPDDPMNTPSIDEQNPDNYVIATKVGGLRVGDLENKAKDKEPGGNSTNTASTYYFPQISNSTTEGEAWNAKVNIALGNNGRLEIPDNQLIVGKRVNPTAAELDEEWNNQPFSYQVYISGLTGEVNVINLEYSELIEAWTPVISQVAVETNNSNLLVGENGDLVQVTEGNQNYNIYFVDPNTAYANLGEEVGTNGNIIIYTNSEELLNSGNEANNITYERADETHPEGSYTLTSGTYYLIPEGTPTIDAGQLGGYPARTGLPLVDIDFDKQASGLALFNANSNYLYKITLATTTIPFNNINTNQFFDPSKGNFANQSGVAEFELSHNKGYLFNGLDIYSEYFVTEKIENPTENNYINYTLEKVSQYTDQESTTYKPIVGNNGVTAEPNNENANFGSQEDYTYYTINGTINDITDSVQYINWLENAPEKLEVAPGAGTAVNVGDNIIYSISYFNATGDDVQVIIEDDLEDGLTFNQAAAFLSPDLESVDDIEWNVNAGNIQGNEPYTSQPIDVTLYSDNNQEPVDAQVTITITPSEGNSPLEGAKITWTIGQLNAEENQVYNGVPSGYGGLVGLMATVNEAAFYDTNEDGTAIVPEDFIDQDFNVENTATVQIGNKPAITTNTVYNVLTDKTEVDPGDKEPVQIGDTVHYQIGYSTYGVEEETVNVTITDPLDPNVAFSSALINIPNDPDNPITLTAGMNGPVKGTGDYEDWSIEYQETYKNETDLLVTNGTYNNGAVVWILENVPQNTTGFVDLYVTVKEGAEVTGIIYNQAIVKIDNRELLTNILQNPLDVGVLAFNKQLQDINNQNNRLNGFNTEYTFNVQLSNSEKVELAADSYSAIAYKYPSSLTVAYPSIMNIPAGVDSGISLIKEQTANGNSGIILGVTEGNEITYELTLRNNSNTTQTISVEDQVPPQTTIIPGSIDPQAIFTAGMNNNYGTIQWNNLELPGGGTETLTYKVSVSERDTLQTWQSSASAFIGNALQVTSNSVVAIENATSVPVTFNNADNYSSEIQLEVDQTCLLLGLPVGATYTITEVDNQPEYPDDNNTGIIPSAGDGQPILNVDIVNQIEGPVKAEIDPGDGASVEVNDEITYSIEFTNYSANEADIIITDPLDPGVDFIMASGAVIDEELEENGALTQVGTTNQTVTISGIEVPVEITYNDQTHTVTWTYTGVPAEGKGTAGLKVQVNENARQAYAPIVGEDGDLGFDQNDGVDATVFNIAGVQVGQDPQILTQIVENPLTPYKTEEDPGENMPVIVDQDIIYNITWAVPDDEETHSVLVTDTLDPGLDFVSAGVQGTEKTSTGPMTTILGTDYNNNDIEWSVEFDNETNTVSWYATDIPSGSIGYVILTVNVNPDAYFGITADNGVDDQNVDLEVENTAYVTVDNGNREQTNTVKNPLTYKTENTPGNYEEVNLNDQITYQIAYKNTAQVPVKIVIEDPLDVGLDFNSADFGDTNSLVLNNTNISNGFGQVQYQDDETDTVYTITYKEDSEVFGPNDVVTSGESSVTNGTSNNGVVTWTIDNIGPGEYGYVYLNVTVNDQAGEVVFNQATKTVFTEDKDGKVVTEEVQNPLTELPDEPDNPDNPDNPNNPGTPNNPGNPNNPGTPENPTQSLTISKQQALNTGNLTKNQLTALPGATVRYALTVKNTGSTTINNIIVTDPVPAGTTIVTNTISNSGVYNAQSNSVAWTISSLSAGSSITLTFNVTLPSNLTTSRTFRNVATATYNDTTVPSNEVIVNTPNSTDTVPPQTGGSVDNNGNSSSTTNQTTTTTITAKNPITGFDDLGLLRNVSIIVITGAFLSFLYIQDKKKKAQKKD